MFYISHRGNINGPCPEKENRPSYITEAINKGYDVEIDVWFVNDNLYLGHDKPQYSIDDEFLLQNHRNLWIHCKNLDALTYLINKYPSLHLFSHDKDPVILTSKKIPWVYPGAPLNSSCICVMPERFKFNCEQDVLGICSDYIEKYSINMTFKNK